VTCDVSPIGAGGIAGDRAFGQPRIGEPGGRTFLGGPSVRCPAAGFNPGGLGRTESGLVGSGLSPADDFLQL
jgi:hypothetical protein